MVRWNIDSVDEPLLVLAKHVSRYTVRANQMRTPIDVEVAGSEELAGARCDLYHKRIFQSGQSAYLQSWIRDLCFSRHQVGSAKAM